MSSRQLSQHLSIAQNFVWRTLLREVIHHLENIQHLQPGVPISCVVFSMAVSTTQSRSEFYLFNFILGQSYI